VEYVNFRLEGGVYFLNFLTPSLLSINKLKLTYRFVISEIIELPELEIFGGGKR
jgi:hypothetical protein